MDLSKPTYVEIGQTVEKSVVAGIELVKLSDMMSILQLADGNFMLNSNSISMLRRQVERLRQPGLTLADCGQNPLEQFEQLMSEQDINRQAVNTLFTKVLTALIDVAARQEALCASMHNLTGDLNAIFHNVDQATSKVNAVIRDNQQIQLPMDAK